MNNIEVLIKHRHYWIHKENNLDKDLDKEKKEIYVMLKLVEGLVKQGIVTETIFKGMLSDFRKKIDTSQFDCYT